MFCGCQEYFPPSALVLSYGIHGETNVILTPYMASVGQYLPTHRNEMLPLIDFNLWSAHMDEEHSGRREVKFNKP